MYADDDAERLRFILMLKTLGLKLSQIRGILESPNRGAILETLLEERALQLEEEIAQSTAMLDGIKIMQSDLELCGHITMTSQAAMDTRMNDEGATETSVGHHDHRGHLHGRRMDWHADIRHRIRHLVAIPVCLGVRHRGRTMAGLSLRRSCDLSLPCLQGGVSPTFGCVHHIRTHATHPQAHVPLLWRQGLVRRALPRRAA